MAQTQRVTIIGAGAGGLAAAIDLARQGIAVTVLEQAAAPGGKIRVDAAGIDSGPTVFTMRWVFESLFADAGTSLDSHLTLRQADLLARHAWNETERLDLFADPAKSADAIAAFAGPKEAAGFNAFRIRARHIFDTLDRPFMRAQKPSALSLTAAAGIGRMRRIAPFSTLWHALGDHFQDPRLRQLFGRYATYSGSSPFECPATLMLIAHVEMEGVWLVDGGMIRLAQAMTDVATELGAVVRLNAPVAEIIAHRGKASGVVLANGERIDSDAVICNADAAAVACGALGRATKGAVAAPKRQARSLSAVTWGITAPTDGFPLARHNVFFSRDYKAEFDAIFRDGRVPEEPTTYICAQDRPGETTGPERLLVLINAPADGDRHVASLSEIEQWTTRTFSLLARCGLTVHRRPETTTVTTPTHFAHRFPATGGALYGQAVHGSMAAFHRPGSRSALPNLYLAGGSVHPGPGVPMAVLSGRLAAQSALQDLTSR